MFDKSRLKEILVKYKADFVSKQWINEKYKWEAIQCFQENWDMNAVDFADMITCSLVKTENLLASKNNFPARMIKHFAKNEPGEVRSMFIELFDESKDIVNRIITFKEKSKILHERYGNDTENHYQHENAISIYLWLRYPDKYYIYKFGEVKTAAEELKCKLLFKRGAYIDNLRNFYKFYDAVCEEISKDKELIRLLASQIDDSCYSDLEGRTLTVDICFYISRLYAQESVVDVNEWYPANYTPQLTVEEWTALLKDGTVFTKESLEIMKRMLDYGGQATCTQLSVRYGENKNFYNRGSSALARRVADKTGCPIMEKNVDNFRWWPILYVGRNAGNDEDGLWIWKLRDELAEALEFVDLSNINLYVSDKNGKSCNYWWLNASPRIWSFSDVEVGEEQAFTLYNDNGHKRNVFQNFLDAKEGDMIVGYESAPIKKIVALGRVSTEQDGEQIWFEKTEGLSSPIDYKTLTLYSELDKMEFLTNQRGTLFKLTPGEFEFIYDLIREENPVASTISDSDVYDKKDFLNEVYMTENRYNMLVSVLENKKNIILQGAPGVGKTFAAKRLAYSMMGEMNEDRIEFIQFHQNYSYEDFMMGYKPVDDGFEMKYGIFYRFCQKAANHPDKDYFFIIDEINRGNMSKIFGELLMLIERDYRGTKATLAYNGLSFTVPKNLYIIGMMNTADRSLAMIDYALRRRFSFFDMEPGFDSEGFVKYQNGLNNETFSLLVTKVQELNKEIANDKSLGKGFCIGHSYFCSQTECNEEWLHSIVDYDILPMLREYWFDDESKIQRWENILRGVFQ